VQVIAGFVAVVGTMLLTVVPLALLTSAHDAWRARQLRATREMPCAVVGRRCRRVAVRGTIGAGPAGLLESPLTATSCVWWTVTVARVDHHEGGGQPPTRHVHRVASVNSATPFTVADRSGPVLVDGRLAEGVGTHDHPLWGGMSEIVCDSRFPPGAFGMLDRLVSMGLVPRQAVRARRATVGFDIRETALPVGRVATVVAGATPWQGRPRLRRRRPGLGIMRPETLAELLRQVGTESRNGLAAAGLCAVLGAAMTAGGLAGLAIVGVP
jgi:hypothetical protein